LKEESDMVKVLLLFHMSLSPIVSFEYRESAPAALFPYVRAAEQCSDPAAVRNPSYLPCMNFMYAGFTAQRPYSMEELSSTSVKTGAGAHGMGFQVNWCRFGIPEYRENSIETGLGYMPWEWFSVGAGLTWKNLCIRTEDISYDKNMYDFNLALLLIPFSWLNISGLLENGMSFFNENRRKDLFPEWSCGASIKALRGLTVSWNITSVENACINTVSVCAGLTEFMCMCGGYSRETSSGSAAFVFYLRNLIFSYGIRYHPHLGYTHSLSLSLSQDHSLPEVMRYNTRPFSDINDKPAEKVNLNRCTADELLELSGINSRTAGRIMKYRKTKGPLTRKALRQIGMTAPEVDCLLEYAYGLAEEKKFNKSFRRTKKGGQNRAVKSLFVRLMGAGISASSALEIATLLRDKKKKEAVSVVNSIRGINEASREKARKICKGL